MAAKKVKRKRTPSTRRVTRSDGSCDRCLASGSMLPSLKHYVESDRCGIVFGYKKDARND